MVSRAPTSSMPNDSLQTPTGSPLWDVFCTVVDNYGDIGVCWRLARQLSREHGHEVRLWVDDLSAFKRICPAIDLLKSSQHCAGVEICHWASDFPKRAPGDIVVEAFGCHLPESFVEAMAKRQPRPVWINLEYLSAEQWVTEYHALPSPHPRLPLTKHFFFPGFSEKTGGLLRESDLILRREEFSASPESKSSFWHSLGLEKPAASTLTITLFAYDNPALNDLLDVWAHGETPIRCLAPATKTLGAIESFAGRRLSEGDSIRRGNLEIHILPFVSQADFDYLLWSCDINFVRGEDSFVRAQWAEKPMIWHIYPQEEAAHLTKLSAFLALYTADLPARAKQPLEQFFTAWNDRDASQRITPDMWNDYLVALAEYRVQAADWSKKLSKQEDLCSQLVRFCQNKL